MIDLITNLDMAAFQTHGGLNAFIQRLQVSILSWIESAGLHSDKYRIFILSGNLCRKLYMIPE